MLFHEGKNVFKNTFVFVVLVLFLTMYGPKFAPNLPNGIKELFENNIFKAAIVFLIVYLSNKNMAISLMMTIIFFFVMSMLNKNYVEGFMIRYGPPLNNCKTEEGKVKNYPLNDKKEKL